MGTASVRENRYSFYFIKQTLKITVFQNFFD
nr:MAG TPA_asm: hypothetical protein [Caudoviricetes sp.]